jgi:hypothetical protein
MNEQNEHLDAMRLTLSEEVDIILTDIFNGDSVGQEYCLQQLASQQDLDLSVSSEEEVQEMILENEDTLYYLYELYTVDNA